MGLLNNVVPMSLIVFGQTTISSGLASVLNATTPFFTTLLLATAGDERLTSRRLAGVLCGVLGVAVLQAPDMLRLAASSFGVLLCLGAAFSYGLAALWARRNLSGTPPLVAATGQLLTFLRRDGHSCVRGWTSWTLPILGTATWLALLGLGLLSTAIAYVLFFQIIARSGPSNVMLVTLMIPVPAILLGHIAPRRELRTSPDRWRSDHCRRTGCCRWTYLHEKKKKKKKKKKKNATEKAAAPMRCCGLDRRKSWISLEVVVDGCAQHVVGDIRAVVRADRREGDKRHRAAEVAKIHVDVFEASAPVPGELAFDAGADGPACVGGAGELEEATDDRGKDGRAVERGQRRGGLHRAVSETAGRVEQDVRRDQDAGAGAHRAEPFDLLVERQGCSAGCAGRQEGEARKAGASPYRPPRRR